MITKTYDNLEPADFYRKFFELYNVIQSNPKNKLRDREIDILAEMIVLNEKFKFKLFKTEGKYEIMKRLNNRYNCNITIDNINTNLSALKKKGLVIQQSDKMRYINPNILKYLDTENKNFEFVFKFNIK